MPTTTEQRRAYHRTYRATHREQYQTYSQTHYAAHREQHNAGTRRWHARIRKEAIEAYGGRCICCDESDLVFLTLDHINGGGNAHRREVKRTQLETWLRDQGYPPGFQVLCYNCNSAKGEGLTCPHQERSTL